MKDEELLREHTDEKGNLLVDRLMGLKLQHVSVLPFGANRREVAAQREAKPVADEARAYKYIRRAGAADRDAVNWITADPPPAALQKRVKDAFDGAVAAEVTRCGMIGPGTPLATDFNGVMRDEFLWDVLALYSRVWRETVLNVLISGPDDPRGEVEAAGAALMAHTLSLLDSSQEFTMSASLDVLRARDTNRTEERPMPMDTETRAALTELERKVMAEISKTTATADAVAGVTHRMGGVLGTFLREAGLPDNHLTDLLQQFTITGQSPISSKMGDVAAMFGGALSSPLNAALTTMGTLFRAARGISADEDGSVTLATESVVRAGLVSTATIMAGKVSEFVRGARRTPAAGVAAAGDGRVVRNPEDQIEGLGGIVSEINRRFAVE